MTEIVGWWLTLLCSRMSVASLAQPQARLMHCLLRSRECSLNTEELMLEKRPKLAGESFSMLELAHTA